MKAQRPRSDPRAWFLVGPTASGKSAVAQYLAEQCSAEILSADAMLVYTGMDIGTAKPTAAERDRVRYHGLDLVQPNEPFSTGAYCQAALSAIRDVCARGRALIVAGGTGLYIKSLTDGLAPRTPGQEQVRAEAEKRLKAGGVGALQDWLRSVDAQRYTALADPENPRRLVRALESALAADPQAQGRWSKPPPHPPIPCLMWSLPQLYDRIQARTRAMFAGGLLAEVERLLQAGFDRAPTARHAIGYAEAMAHLRAECSLEDAIIKTILRSRQFAKRQMTWFRHQCKVEWLAVDASMTTADIAAVVREQWRKHGPTPVAGCGTLSV